MNGIARNVLIGGGILAGATGIVGLIAWGAKNGEKHKERLDVTETPFESMKGYANSDFDTNKDGLIDRKTETVRFPEPDIKSGARYYSIRQVADAADMIVGNRDGFMSANEYQDLARLYTTREGAIGLTGREASVFGEDYRMRIGDGGTVADMTGNPYL